MCSVYLVASYLQTKGKIGMTLIKGVSQPWKVIKQFSGVRFDKLKASRRPVLTLFFAFTKLFSLDDIGILNLNH